MANGFVEIHDPLSNGSNHTTNTNCEPKSTSDTNSMGDTVEFRLLMAYAQRRRPKKEDVKSSTQDSPVAPNGDAVANGPSSPQTPATADKKRKKGKRKRAWKRLSKVFLCLKPQIQEDESTETTEDRSFVKHRSDGFQDDISEKGKVEDELDEVALRLTEIADEIPFVPPEIQEDAPIHDANVEKIIGLILREAGDKLNEAELKDASIASELFLNYNFFRNLMTALLERMGLRTSEPNALGPQASPKTQIAVTCEVTSRLSAVNTHPMSRMLVHGARYLQEYYSSWIQQQGGIEKAFESEDEDESQCTD